MILTNLIDSIPLVQNLNDTLYFNINSSGLIYYRWINCDSNYSLLVSNTKKFAPTKPGNYAVVFNIGGCYDTSLCYPFHIMGSIFEKQKAKNQLYIYPNPTTNLLIISSESALKSIEITDVLGRTLIQLENITKNTEALFQPTQIDVSKLLNGIYFIKATNYQGNIFNKKFIKN